MLKLLILSLPPGGRIRQGNPLSPYFFVLCMEQLNQIIEESIIRGAWKPIYSSRCGQNSQTSSSRMIFFCLQKHLQTKPWLLIIVSRDFVQLRVKK